MGLRVELVLSRAQATMLERLKGSGFFGGPHPTLASVAEELLREKLRECVEQGFADP